MRRERGITQVDLAKRLGRPQPFVSHVERGERRVDVIEFCEIAEALEIPPETLFRRFMATLKKG